MLIISLISIFSLMAQAPQTEAGSFDDLGKLLFGGLLSAVCVAIVIVFLKLKSQGKEGATTDFLSITQTKHKDQD
jgi:uncharacterized membrane protein